jgi:glucosamine kinase
VSVDELLAMDAGQTGIKVRLHSGGRTTTTTFPGIRTNAPLTPQLAAAAREVLHGRDVPPLVLAAGVSGLTDAEAAADADALARLLSDTAVHRVLLAHDSTTSYLGALGEARGAVVAAGTGVVTLAVGAERVTRVDGWGHTMGDAGSGFWIGREVLSAVMRAYDGRGPETSLVDEVTAVWPSLPDAYIQLQTDPDWVRRVASFARAAAAHHEAGDAVATGILDRAARELALSVTAGLRTVGAADDADARVCMLGGVFGSPRVRAEFTRALAGAGVAASLVDPLGDGLDGVEGLAGLPIGHPLAARVATSG